jgi:transcriptional regulator with XRE-family HTH domain
MPNPASETILKRRLGAAVRFYRHRLGMSQDAFAEHADMHRTYLADIERGTRNVALTNLARLADSAGVPLSRLLAKMETIELPDTKSGKRKR